MRSVIVSVAWLFGALAIPGCGTSTEEPNQTRQARGGAKATGGEDLGETGGVGTGGTMNMGGTGSSAGGIAGATDVAGGTSGPPPAGPWSSLVAPTDKVTQVQTLATFGALSTDSLIARSDKALARPLGYAPDTAKWLDLIQASSLALNQRELAAYQQNGFVISNRQSYPNFFYGYKTIYSSDLPLYVTADSILYALHRSYDKVLSETELGYLTTAINTLLGTLRANLAKSAARDSAKHDVGLLLGVAAGLLDSTATGLDSEMLSLIAKVKTASGIANVALFGSNRDIDFSQFLPRGHYASDSRLQAYFRALMWLGRVEFRLVDMTPSGQQVLNRREIEATLALDEAFEATTREQWSQIDRILSLFVGEADYMTIPQVAALRTSLGVTSSAGLDAIADTQLLSTLNAGSFGIQRISSQLMEVDDNVTALPRSFAFLGQRFTVDGYVFTKVVYPNTGTYRMMPNPLDVAFAALGNDQAAPLLRSELETFQYAPSLGKARQLVEWHGADYWDSNLYTLWTSALRELSPGRTDATQLPAVAQTDAWGRRLLNTQLASWAELRHDTLLYAKQSYTGIPSCEYPDGYVDPYPQFYARLNQLGTLGARQLSAVLPASWTAIPTYFQNLASIAQRLETLANEQLTGAPRTAEDLAFFNDAVTTKQVSVVCTTVTQATGWYTKLFYNSDDAMKADPTIADVHTQPADEGGNIVGKVLHVATGNPRLMVISVDSCDGPRAYAGVVSAYFEQTTDQFKRKTDQEWATELNAATPADVPWLANIVVR